MCLESFASLAFFSSLKQKNKIFVCGGSEARSLSASLQKHTCYSCMWIVMYFLKFKHKSEVEEQLFNEPVYTKNIFPECRKPCKMKRS